MQAAMIAVIVIISIGIAILLFTVIRRPERSRSRAITATDAPTTTQCAEICSEVDVLVKAGALTTDVCTYDTCRYLPAFTERCNPCSVDFPQHCASAIAYATQVEDKCKNASANDAACITHCATLTGSTFGTKPDNACIGGDTFCARNSMATCCTTADTSVCNASALLTLVSRECDL